MEFPLPSLNIYDINLFIVIDVSVTVKTMISQLL